MALNEENENRKSKKNLFHNDWRIKGLKRGTPRGLPL